MNMPKPPRPTETPRWAIQRSSDKLLAAIRGSKTDPVTANSMKVNTSGPTA